MLRGQKTCLFQALFLGSLEFLVRLGNAGQLGFFCLGLGIGVGGIFQNRDMHQEEQFGTVVVAVFGAKQGAEQRDVFKDWHA